MISHLTINSFIVELNSARECSFPKLFFFVLFNMLCTLDENLNIALKVKVGCGYFQVVM